MAPDGCANGPSRSRRNSIEPITCPTKLSIREINRDPNLTQAEKARAIHDVLSKKWQAKGQDAQDEIDDPEHQPTYHTLSTDENPIFGCQHYQRGCKMKAPCCGKLFTCRLCHDAQCDHKVDRYKVTTMWCMHCHHEQPVAKHCAKCHEVMGEYHCSVCNFWDNSPDSEVFHCDKCGLCRRGNQDDFFHCDKCNVCIAVSMRDDHKCIERSLESNCPICHEYLFTSVAPVRFMACGHPIHEECFWQWTQHHYACPICMKSLGNTDHLFDRIEEHLAQVTMPDEYQDHIALVLCNDCLKKTATDFHFMYHKCQACSSFNTNMITFNKRSELDAQIVDMYDRRAELFPQTHQQNQPRVQRNAQQAGQQPPTSDVIFYPADQNAAGASSSSSAQPEDSMDIVDDDSPPSEQPPPPVDQGQSNANSNANSESDSDSSDDDDDDEDDDDDDDVEFSEEESSVPLPDEATQQQSQAPPPPADLVIDSQPPRNGNQETDT